MPDILHTNSPYEPGGSNVPASHVTARIDDTTSGFHELLMQAPVAIVIFGGPQYIILFANELYAAMMAKTRAELMYRPAFEAIPAAANQGFIELLDDMRITGIPSRLNEHKSYIERNGELETAYLNIVYQPLKAADGTVDKILILVTDVTEQVVARKKLEESENRFRSLVEEATIATAVLTGPDMVLELANDAMFQIWGRDDSIVGQPLLQFMPEIKDQPFPKLLDTVYKTGQTYSQQDALVLLQRKGELQTIYMDFSYTPLLNQEGAVYSILVSAVDVTEKVLARLKIEESEAQFRNFSNNITNLAWMADGNGWIYWYNQRWYDYTGTTLEEMQGWGWEKVHHPAHIEGVLTFVKEAWHRDAPFELTFPLRRHDGEYRWFLTRAVPVKNEAGAIYRWIGTNTDIHDQKLAEERFRTLADTLPQLVWMTDAAGAYEYASNQWKEYSGIDPHAENGWETLIHPDDIAAITQTWQHCLETGARYRAEVRLKNKRGQYRWFSVQGEPLRDAQGKILKWIGAFTDTHDQKTMTEKLEQLVAQRTRELQRSNEDLQQFAHVASHDLKEPVRKIRTFGNRLSMEFGALLPERGRTYLDKIEAAAGRMYAMIDGVLDYSILSTADQVFESVDLTKIIHQIETDLEVVIQQREATITCNNLPALEGSEILLYQLFYNLINNALKFSKADRAPVIQISADVRPGAVAAREWGLSAATNYAQVIVQDNGIGFSQDQAERIFKTFTRLNARDKYEGTGLGLALCKKIVERHYGAITAIGMEGMGAIFNIVLPLQQPRKDET